MNEKLVIGSYNNLKETYDFLCAASDAAKKKHEMAKVTVIDKRKNELKTLLDLIVCEYVEDVKPKAD